MTPDLTARDGAADTAPRGFWPMRDLPTVLWLVLTGVAVLAHRSIPVPQWLMIHLLLLGAVTHAILVWSQYFSFALLRTRASLRDRRTQSIRLILSNGGAALVCIGVPAGIWPVTVTGAAVLAFAVGWHAASLWRRTRSALPGRFGRTIDYYIVSAALLLVGLVLGAVIAHGDAPHLVLAHALVNMLGWVGVTVAGTVVTLWPTILRTKADEHAATGARRALPGLAAGALLAAGGAAAQHPVLLGLGLLLYLAGLVVIGVSLFRAARAKPPQSFAALSVAAALLWWIGIVAVLVVQSAIAFGQHADFADLSQLIHGVVPYLTAGFAAQVLVGALSYLIPVVLGGGPGAVRVGDAAFDRLGVLRVTSANAALVVCALPVSSVMRVAASVLYFLAMVSFLAVLALGMRAQRRAKDEGAPERAVTDRERNRSGQATAGLLVTALVVAVTAATDPVGLGWGAASIGSADAPDGAVQTVQVAAADMRFTPSEIEVPVGTRLVIELSNTDAELEHDLVFANGLGGERIAPGESTTIDVGVIEHDLDGWCSIIGHRQMGMVLTIVAVGADDSADDGHSGHGASDPASLDLTAEPSDGFEPYDAELPPLPPSEGPVTHRITLRAEDAVQEVAPGVTQTLWTFGGTAPGPTLHGRVGDTFEVTLINDASMGHSIDFHAGSLAPDEPMRTIQPGERLVYTFTADRSGIWMYHCATMPMTAHIANGMYGAVVIEPEDLPAVDRSYVLVQGEYYLGDPDGGQVDADKITGRSPDLVVFNGTADQYDHAPLPARVGERVRFWVLDAGIERPSSFHVVGGRFDTVWSEGRYLIDRATGTGSQALGLLPAQGGFVELVFPEAGDYPFVSHLMTDAERGAHGVVRVKQD